MNIYLINPFLWIRTKSKLFGYFKFDEGWGFNFGLFGFNIKK